MPNYQKTTAGKLLVRTLGFPLALVCNKTKTNKQKSGRNNSGSSLPEKSKHIRSKELNRKMSS